MLVCYNTAPQPNALRQDYHANEVDENSVHADNCVYDVTEAISYLELMTYDGSYVKKTRMLGHSYLKVPLYCFIWTSLYKRKCIAHIPGMCPICR